jgi:hypothetical protein
LPFVVSRKADDPGRWQNCADVGNGQIILPDVNPGGAAQPRNIGAIVDDEQRFRLARTLHQSVCQL